MTLTLRKTDLCFLLALAVLLVPDAWLEGVGGQRIAGVALVYETDDTTPAMLAHAKRALDKLHERGLRTWNTDDDVMTGDGGGPKELERAIEAARKHGLPALVLVSADFGVVGVHSVPATEAEVLEVVP